MNPIHVIEQAITEAARILSARFGAQADRFDKGERDYALDTDREVEHLYAEILRTASPDVPILGEELSPDAVGPSFEGRFWTVDPIDGTVNFSRGIPEFGTAIALVENCRPVAAGICFPALGETYVAESGAGARLNGASLRVSGVSNIAEAIVGFGDFAVGEGREAKNAERYEAVRRLGDTALRVRMPGTAALQLAWVAAGRFDASVTLGNRAWDVQAGVLMVREAGGRVYDAEGMDHSTRSRVTLASGSALAPEILRAVYAPKLA